MCHKSLMFTEYQQTDSTASSQLGHAKCQGRCNHNPPLLLEKIPHHPARCISRKNRQNTRSDLWQNSQPFDTEIIMSNHTIKQDLQFFLFTAISSDIQNEHTIIKMQLTLIHNLSLHRAADRGIKSALWISVFQEHFLKMPKQAKNNTPKAREMEIIHVRVWKTADLHFLVNQ